MRKYILILTLLVLVSCQDVSGIIQKKYTSNTLPQSHATINVVCGFNFIDDLYECSPQTVYYYTHDRFGYLFDIISNDYTITIEVKESTYNKYNVGDKFDSAKEK